MVASRARAGSVIESVPLLPAALGPIRWRASARPISAVQQCSGEARAASAACAGKSKLPGRRKKRPLWCLVCRCTSSHDQKTRQTLFQRLAGRTYRSGSVGKGHRPLARLPSADAKALAVVPAANVAFVV